MVGLIYRNEMRAIARDRRAVFLSVVLPLLIMPVMLYASRWVVKEREKDLRQITFRYAVAGFHAAFARELMEDARGPLPTDKSEPAEHCAAGDREDCSDEATAREGTPGDDSSGRFPFQEVAVDSPLESLNRGDIHLYLEASAEEPIQVADRESAEGEPGGRGQAPGDGRTAQVMPDRTTKALQDRAHKVEEPPGVIPVIRLHIRGDREASLVAGLKMRRRLQALRRTQQGRLLKDHGFGLEMNQVAAVDLEDLATPRAVRGAVIGRFLSAFILLFLIAGGAQISTDSIAAEKERGTLATLLSTAVRRSDIVLAKHLAILTVALVISVVQLGGLVVWVGLGLIEVPAQFAPVLPAGTIAFLIVLFAPAAALTAGVLLVVSSYAGSYKEAQLYTIPVVPLGLILALAPVLPGIELRSAIALVPLANISVAVREVLMGYYDWPVLAVAWLLTAGAAAGTMKLAERGLTRDRLLPAERPSGAAAGGRDSLFSQHVLRWFAVMWAIMFVACSTPWLRGVYSQVVFNLVLLFPGSVWLMIRCYRLEPREALALRGAKTVVWFAVVVGALATVPLGVGVLELARTLFPFPEELLKHLARSLVPPELGLWQLLLLLAVLPAISEEVAFRGMLLHGLRARWHPVVLCLVVGMVFGFFHQVMIRILPTTLLGVLLSAVVLMTGSIFTAIAWHVLYNGLMIVMMRFRLFPSTLSPAGYLLAAAVLGLALVLIWKNRSPYPGLRKPWPRTEPG